MLQIENLEISYGKVKVLSDISFKADPNSILAIIGPNGSGKSSLIKGILGLVKPSLGAIRMKQNMLESNNIGYMPQSPSFPKNIKMKELLAFFKKIETVEKISYDQIFTDLELEPHLEKKFGSLSGGTKQKVSILQCFSVQKPIYIVDEPTASLDPYVSHLLKQMILRKKKEGALVIFSTHMLSEVQEIADRFLLLSEGKLLIDETPIEFLSKNQQVNLQNALMDFWNKKFTH
jgi:Cu-processing system ATP-binding protein